MRLTQVVPSLEDQYGGPSRSVLALSQGFAAIGEPTELLTTHPETEEVMLDGNLTVRAFRRQWHRVCTSAGLRRHLRDVATDVIHYHSLWLRPLHYAHLAAQKQQIPLVISPRGMMNPWAWEHHGWRKQVALRLIHPGAFAETAGWHATSEEEANDIRGLGFKQPICVAPNGVTAPTEEERRVANEYWAKACPDVGQKPIAVFYSRFHRKKRVLELIDTWLASAPADWVLLMVGIPEDYSVRDLERYVTRASGAGRVRIHNGMRRPAPYGVGSIFLLPSHSENFGLVIAEAMAWGLPVLVTDTTPWTSVNAENVGWCVSWQDYPQRLRDALTESADSRTSRGTRAREWVLREFSWTKSAGLLRDFYQTLPAKGA